jgi:glutamyl-tRNA synthetase
MVRRQARWGQRRTAHPVRCAAMSSPRLDTRFAPSPTGSLHLGNARTALFNFLAARSSGGRFILRIEDTDAERSADHLLQQQLADLRWLGLQWDEGPDVGGPHAPYRQSERASHYSAAVESLQERGMVYPCFCSPEELQLSRRAQLSAGRPPRYARTCAALSAEDVAHRLASGKRPALRFRVPDHRTVEFDDLIHGPQRFATNDIGDFVILRADGSAAFFLGNAVDDAAMGVSLVLRGDDHLANTPRQILLLQSLGMEVPRYGHLPLLLAPSGTPLSKREGAASLHDLRELGFIPSAICNYLVRLGHACGHDAWLDLADMPRHFDLARTSHSAARFDEAQLRHWQREALSRASGDEVREWLGHRLERLGDAARQQAFVAAVRGNVLLPADVDVWLRAACDEDLVPSPDAAAQISSAGPAFFAAAEHAWPAHAAALFMPLRAALTGETHGPELAPFTALMGPERVAHRLASAQRRAAA